MNGSFRKILYLLSKAELRDLFFLFLMLLAGMVLETLSVGIVIPLLAFLGNPQSTLTKFSDVPGVPFLQTLGDTNVVIFVMAGVLALFVFKGFLLASISWAQFRFVFGLQAALARRMFEGYLRKDFLYHLSKNSSELIRNTIQETLLLTQSTLMASLFFFTELFVIIGICVLLVFIEPLGAVIVLIIFFSAASLYLFLAKPYIARWGKIRQQCEGQRLQFVQQGLGATKEVKILGREQEFIDGFERPNSLLAKIGSRISFVQSLPKLWLEVLAIISISLIVFTFVWRDEPIADIIPLLGLFAAAAFRLLPSMNRLLGAIQNVRYSLPAIDVIYRELSDVGAPHVPAKTTTPPFEKTIDLQDIGFHYNAHQAASLKSVSFTIQKGETWGVVGRSGAGKSTLIDIILGLITPTDGVISADGVDIQANMRGWQDHIGYVPQKIYITDDTIIRNVAFGIPDREIDSDAVEQALKAAQIFDFVSGLPDGLDTVLGEHGARLSGGQQQRIGIARALYHNPTLLVLDEATSALDQETEREVMKAIYGLRGTKTILIVTHRLTTVEQCDQIAHLKEGEIIAIDKPAILIPSLQRQFATPSES